MVAHSVAGSSGGARETTDEIASSAPSVIIAATTFPSPVRSTVLSTIGEVAVYTPASSVTQSCTRFHGRIETCLLLIRLGGRWINHRHLLRVAPAGLAVLAASARCRSRLAGHRGCMLAGSGGPGRAPPRRRRGGGSQEGEGGCG